MRTVQMTLDDALVQEIDHVVKQLRKGGGGAEASGRICPQAGNTRRV